MCDYHQCTTDWLEKETASKWRTPEVFLPSLLLYPSFFLFFSVHVHTNYIGLDPKTSHNPHQQSCELRYSISSVQCLHLRDVVHLNKKEIFPSHVDEICENHLLTVMVHCVHSGYQMKRRKKVTIAVVKHKLCKITDYILFRYPIIDDVG